MHTVDPIRVVRLALRLSLASAFLSAVADRFGWWEELGRGSWGSMGAFADYVRQLVPFASGWLLTVIVWAATVAEVTLGVLLLIGWRPKLVGAATCLTLTVFGTAMAVSLGVETPLSYSVFSAASAAAAYAILPTTAPPPTTDTPHRSFRQIGRRESRRRAATTINLLALRTGQARPPAQSSTLMTPSLPVAPTRLRWGSSARRQ
jgi:uncharacterized membrane protein YphA (DoxX/SURF4 family)